MPEINHSCQCPKTYNKYLENISQKSTLHTSTRISIPTTRKGRKKGHEKLIAKFDNSLNFLDSQLRINGLT